MNLFDAEFHAVLAALRRAARPDARARPFGTRPVRGAGPGMEFLGHREYGPGDDPRRVDWHAYGRTERLYAKTFRREETGLLRIAIDASASMSFGAPSKFDVARRLAGLLGARSLWGDGRIAACSGGRRWDGAGGTDAVLARWLEFLSSLRGSPGPTLAADLSLPVSSGRGGAAAPGSILVVLTDGWDLPAAEAPLREAARGTRGSAIVRILSEPERAPSPRGTVRLRDAETDRTVRLQAGSAAVARYGAAFDGWTARCRGLAHGVGLDWIDLAAEAPLAAQATSLDAREGSFTRP